MSRARGHVLQRAFAHYLTAWWPSAESTPNGRPGRDVLGTPGVWWEVKSSLAGTSPAAVVAQAVKGASEEAKRLLGTDKPGVQCLPVVVYFPPGIGAARPDRAIAMLPLPELMQLLVDAGYAPAPKEDS